MPRRDIHTLCPFSDGGRLSTVSLQALALCLVFSIQPREKTFSILFCPMSCCVSVTRCCCERCKFSKRSLRTSAGSRSPPLEAAWKTQSALAEKPLVVPGCTSFPLRAPGMVRDLQTGKMPKHGLLPAPRRHGRKCSLKAGLAGIPMQPSKELKGEQEGGKKGTKGTSRRR